MSWFEFEEEEVVYKDKFRYEKSPDLIFSNISLKDDFEYVYLQVDDLKDEKEKDGSTNPN